MIIKLDWFSCSPTKKWEAQIHQTLEELGTLKQISQASVRVEETTESAHQFHLTLMLRMPGPDVLSHGTGSTFEEALLKLGTAARKTLMARASKARETNSAGIGVKATHRG